MNVSSAAQAMAPADGVRFGPGLFPTYDAPKAYDRWRVYGETKLANMLFTEELQVRREGKGQAEHHQHNRSGCHTQTLPSHSCDSI